MNAVKNEEVVLNTLVRHDKIGKRKKNKKNILPHTPHFLAVLHPVASSNGPCPPLLQGRVGRLGNTNVGLALDKVLCQKLQLGTKSRKTIEQSSIKRIVTVKV